MLDVSAPSMGTCRAAPRTVGRREDLGAEALDKAPDVLHRVGLRQPEARNDQRAAGADRRKRLRQRAADVKERQAEEQLPPAASGSTRRTAQAW